MYNFLRQIGLRLQETRAATEGNNRLYHIHRNKECFIQVFRSLYEEYIFIYYQIRRRRTHHIITMLPREILLIIFSYIISPNIKFDPHVLKHHLSKSIISSGLTNKYNSFMYQSLRYLYIDFKNSEQRYDLLIKFNEWSNRNIIYFQTL
jgi:hypothetical protein